MTNALCSASNGLMAKNIHFGYGRRTILAGVDFCLEPGEMLGLVGPNGSGKSTLLGIIAGLLAPNRGHVLLCGRDIRQMSRMEIARRIGLVSQHPQIAPGFTVMETALSGRFALMSGRVFENGQDRAEAHRALSAVGLEHLADRRAGNLSGGELQRLALARALAANPGILLLDEPTSALDMDFQVGVMELLEALCEREGRAVCIVSHDLNLAAMYCRKMILLKDGARRAFGPVEDVLTRENLRGVYGVKTVVDREPTRGRPRITLVPSGL